MPRAASSAASFAGVASSHESARILAPGLQMRNDRLERPAMQRDQRAILLAPAEPRGGEREGRGRRHADHLARRRSAASASSRRRRRTDRRSPARRRDAAPRFDQRRARPRSAKATHRSRRRDRPASARWRAAADDEGRLREELSRGRREAVDPILADADDGEPSLLAHGAHPCNRLRLLILGGTTEASALARRLAGEPSVDAVAVARRRDRQSRAGARFRSASAASAARRARRISSGGKDRRGGRRDPPVRRAHVGERRRSLPGDATPLVVFTRPPWRREAGDRWTRSPRWTPPSRRWGRRARPCS